MLFMRMYRSVFAWYLLTQNKEQNFREICLICAAMWDIILNEAQSGAKQYSANCIFGQTQPGTAFIESTHFKIAFLIS